MKLRLAPSRRICAQMYGISMDWPWNGTFTTYVVTVPNYPARHPLRASPRRSDTTHVVGRRPCDSRAALPEELAIGEAAQEPRLRLSGGEGEVDPDRRVKHGDISRARLPPSLSRFRLGFMNSTSGAESFSGSSSATKHSMSCMLPMRSDAGLNLTVTLMPVEHFSGEPRRAHGASRCPRRPLDGALPCERAIERG